MTGLGAAPADAPARIGILAGAGDFPLLIAGAARSSGVEVIGIGIKGFASPDLEKCCDRTCWVELGQATQILNLLKRNDVTAVTLAGRVPHSTIFQYRHFDLRAVKMLARAVTRRADALLGTVTQELEGEGIRRASTPRCSSKA